MDITIREAKISDLSSVLALYAYLLTDKESEYVLTLKEAKKIFKQIKKYPDYKLFIAMIEKELVGTFALLIMDNIGHMGMPIGIVENFVVKPDYRRKGIGARMMEFAMDYSKKKGCYKMMLSSNMKRKKAHHFYASLGFMRHGYSFYVSIKEDQ